MDANVLSYANTGETPLCHHLKAGTACHDRNNLMKSQEAEEFTRRLTSLLMFFADPFLAPDGVSAKTSPSAYQSCTIMTYSTAIATE